MQRSEIKGKMPQMEEKDRCHSTQWNTNPCGSSPRRGTCTVLKGWRNDSCSGQWEGSLQVSHFFFFPLRAKPQRKTFRCSNRRQKQYSLKYARVSHLQQEITLAFYILFWKIGAEETFISLLGHKITLILTQTMTLQSWTMDKKKHTLQINECTQAVAFSI